MIHLGLSPSLWLVAWLLKHYVPPRPNHWIGYRTPRSMKSEETWKAANRYAAQRLQELARYATGLELLLFLLTDEPTAILGGASLMAVAALAIIPLTERMLREREKNSGQVKRR